MLDRGGGGAYYLSSPEKGGLFDLGGLNIGFTVHFTIIGVKTIILRFFISWFHCIRAYRYIVLC